MDDTNQDDRGKGILLTSKVDINREQKHVLHLLPEQVLVHSRSHISKTICTLKHFEESKVQKLKKFHAAFEAL